MATKKTGKKAAAKKERRKVKIADLKPKKDAKGGGFGAGAALGYGGKLAIGGDAALGYGGKLSILPYIEQDN